MRLATIDIGTNSVLLLIAESTGSGLVPVLERATITRLGQDVDRTHQLHPDAIARTLACLRDYAKDIADHGASEVLAVSTSAARDAQGASAFIEAASSILGVAPRVISGNEEAHLTFLGALSGLEVRGEVVVVDIGGGSTELVRGTIVGGQLPTPERGVSVDIGSVRLTERHLRSDPPTRAEQEAVRESVWTATRALPTPASEATWIGIGGTVTTLAAIQAGLHAYDARVVHGSVLARSDITKLRQRLAEMTAEARRATPGLNPKRADIIVAGAIEVEALQSWADCERWIVSDRGVRWGLALAAFGTT